MLHSSLPLPLVSAFTLLALLSGCDDGPSAETKSTEILVSELRDGDPLVRRAAAEALSERKDPAAIEPLVAALADEDEDVRTTAGIALEWFGPAAVGPLAAAREKADEDGASVYESVLFSIGARLPQEALIDVLASPDRNVRMFALEHLRTVRDPRALGSLLELASDEAALVRILAIRGLADLRAAAAFDRLLEVLSGDPDPDVRAEAALALGALEDARAVEPLLAAVASEDEAPRVREDAISALGRLGDARAVPALAPLLGNGSLAGPAASALGRIGEPAVSVLVEALRNGSNEYPGAIGEALAAIGEPAVPPLIEILESGRYPAWVRAARVLGDLGESRAVPPLVAVIGRNRPYDTQRAAEALAGIESPEAEAALLAAFEAGDHAVIAGAHRFFVRRGAPGSERRILTALDREGDSGMAETLLNCGNAELVRGAEAWATRNGYEVHEFPMGGGGPSWGGR